MNTSSDQRRLITYKTNTIHFDVEILIFTMVSFFLRWTLLKFFSSFPDEQSQQKVRHLGRITCVVINTSNEVMCPLLWKSLNLKLFSGNFWKGLCWKHCKYKEWVSFYLDSWGMNRSAEQTNRTRTASRFMRFVCTTQRFIPHEPRKKDTHSLNNKLWDVSTSTYSFVL